ncbi:hypothetical protein [Paludibacter sp.]|uniref:hypothetical protein n=1 Tax=Paludibacter sp. TaxID=1898105 RepID=UPI0013547F67|nr:hypothetical protein [Paludibacter sp.]MTK54023.1 hypothetical protein [Paludibacter sp.]
MLIIIASFGLTYNIIYPVMSPEQISAHPDAFEKFGMLRWEDGKNHQLPQDFADMVGWQDMANKALMAYKTIPVNEQESTLIFCDNYGQAGALNYYNRGKMKEAYSFNTDYIFWLPKMKNIKNIILIGNLPNKDVLSQFETVQQTGTIENQYAREKGTCVFILRNGKPEWTSMFYKLAKNRILANDIF